MGRLVNTLNPSSDTLSRQMVVQYKLEGRMAVRILSRIFGREHGHLQEPVPPTPIPGRDLVAQLHNQFQGSDDVRFHTLNLANTGVRATIVYVEGLVDAARVEEAVVGSLIRWAYSASAPELRNARNPETLRSVIPAMDSEVTHGFEESVAAVLTGDVIIAVDGEKRGLRIANRGAKARDVEEPGLEVTIRGPRDSFTETLSWNLALIRRRVRDPHLRVRLKKVGRRSRTDVAIVYIDGVAGESLVKEIESRVDAIDIDGILDTGYIEQLIEDEWYSPFPQHLKTERPDRAVASLLEGRAVLLADTTPYVLMMPATLDSFFHSPEDSYDRFWIVNILRWVRFLASIIGVVAPSLYVALVAFHPNILPTELVLTIQSSREGVAFPVLIEALLMQFFLELIKEAGLRLPGPLGQTFGIVGGLILGDIGIRAGLVSEAMVIVVAATAISSFASIDRELGTVLRLLGLPIMLSSAVFGLYGFIMASLAVGIHLATLRSYGVPYLAPYPYYSLGDIKDTLFKGPLRNLRRRPSYLHTDNVRRVDTPPDPSPPKENQ